MITPGARLIDLSGLEDAFEPINISSPTRTYTVTELLSKSGDTSNLYRCHFTNDPSQSCLLKIVRNPIDNDLAANESGVLLHFDKVMTNTAKKYFPKIIDSFMAKDGDVERQVTIFPYTNDCHTFTEILEIYPHGIEPEDMWICNRVMEALYFTHQAGVVHGGIIPHNVIIRAENHGIMLIDWSYTVEIGRPLIAINREFELWYPIGFKNKAPTTTELDVHMAKKCILMLLGADKSGNNIPNTVPDALVKILNNSNNNAELFREEFGKALKSLFGKKFRPLTMPKRI